jgi:hypothetical protein
MASGWATKFVSRRALSLALATAVAGFGAATVQAADFFDWGQNVNTVNPAYVKTPVLTDQTAAQVAAFLNSQPPGATLAVQVPAGTSLSASTINLIFNNAARPVKYVFADYEGPNTVSQITTLVNQIQPTATGASIAAGNSFIGNYGLAPMPSDPTTPSGATHPTGNALATGSPYLTATDFRNTGVNMSNEQLYPGDSSFRNPISGNSTAPNIRSALFTLPIQRLSIATANLGGGQAHVPFITRFNNYTNPAFQNTTTTIPNPQGGFIKGFDTSVGGPQNAGQLPSRVDFQALTLHYRMRGATGYQLLDPGVVGYTVSDYENDAQTGWNNSIVSSVLAGTNGRVAALPTVVTFNGTKKTIEDAGVVYSAVTNDDTATPGLAILVSNLSNTAGTVQFNTRINGATLSYTTGSLAAGSHTILRFSKAGSLWATPLSDPFYTGTDPALLSRDGIGIPEPTSLSLLGIGAIGVLSRRRRKA